MRWRRRDTKLREREGQDDNGEPHAQHCWEWRWGKRMLFASPHGKMMEERETMGKGGGGTNNEMRWYTSLGWARKMEDVKKELDEEDLDLQR
jgi:hypothetical protein